MRAMVLPVVIALMALGIGDARAAEPSSCAWSTGKAAVSPCTEIIENPALGKELRILALRNRAKAYIEIKQFRKATADLRKIFDARAATAEDYWLNGLSHYWLGNYQQAERSLAKASSKAAGNIAYIIDFARAQVMAGHPKQAIDRLTTLIEKSPGHAALLASRGWAHYYSGDYGKALADYDKAIALDRNNPHWFNERGLVHHAREDYAAAERDAASAIALNNKDAAFWLNRGLQRRADGNLEGALNDFDVSLALERRGDALAEHADMLIDLGRLDEAELEIKESLRRSGPTSRTLTVHGRLLAARGDYAGGRRKYRAARAADPSNTAARYWNAISYYQEGQYRAALKKLKNLQSVLPDNAVLMNDIGLVQIELGNLDLAIKQFSQAVLADKNYPEAYENRAHAHLLAGHWDAAIRDAEWALKRNKKRARPHYQRAFARWRQGDLQSALDGYSKAISIDSGYSFAFRERAELLLEMGRLEEARLDAEQLLRLDSGNPDHHRLRALISENLGQFQDAISHYDKALSIDADNIWSYEGRAWAYAGLDRLADAMSDCRKFLEKSPLEPAARRCLAMVKSRSDDKPGALEELAAALRLNPNYAPALYETAIIDFQEGRFEEAITGFSAALALGYKVGGSYVHRGDAHAELGVPGRALADYERALANADDKLAQFISDRIRKLKSRTGQAYGDELYEYPQAIHTQRQ